MYESIELCNVDISFKKGNSVVKNVTTKFNNNQITAIIGESGSGKSVLGMSLLNLLPEYATIEGKAIYQNSNLYDLSNQEFQRKLGKEITWIPQNAKLSLNPMLNVRKQLEEILSYHDPKLTKNERMEIMKKALHDVGFSEPEKILKLRPSELSGGMAQRVVMLFGLLTEPKWIIADEPTKGLDAVIRKQVFELLTLIKEERNPNMIIITHDLPLAYHFCDEILVMRQGEIIEKGTPEYIFFESTNAYTKKLVDSIPSRWN